MKKIIVIILLSFTSIFADEEVNLDSLYKEGIEIYRNAKASWLGNELLIKLLKQAGTEESLGGYFAYPENDGNHFIFYSKDAKVIAEAYFDSTFKTPQTSVKFIIRDFNDIETKYYKIKTATKKYQSQDSSIRYYENTGMNEIPIIFEGKMKCYILTAPNYLGQVIYGNDYCLDMDENYKITKVTDYHKTIIPVPYAKDTLFTQSYHTHTDEIGYLPTPTDIATTLLYGDLAGWTQHFIQSSKLSTRIDIKSKKVQIGRVTTPPVNTDQQTYEAKDIKQVNKDKEKKK